VAWRDALPSTAAAAWLMGPHARCSGAPCVVRVVVCVSVRPSRALRRCRPHTNALAGLLLFAAASPLAAVATYGLLSRTPLVAHHIPLVVLFSGGTVLYAATAHILPSALASASAAASSSSPGGDGDVHGHVHGQGAAAEHAHGLDRRQLLLVTAGMAAPLLLSSLFHEHAH
jgi:hypothetical protein